MSAYEDAMEAAVEPVAEGLKARQRAADFTSAFGLDTSLFWNDPRLMVKNAIDAFLAALPPSIVVDGQVVETYAVLGVMNRERKLEVSMMELLDAAREVARGEGR